MIDYEMSDVWLAGWMNFCFVGLFELCSCKRIFGHNLLLGEYLQQNKALRLTGGVAFVNREIIDFKAKALKVMG